MNKTKNILQTLGPGILFASTAIGVSHLVQSTQAGATYGFSLLWAVVLANLLKYPFFEYGSRYANATGTSLIDGYKKLGKWALWSYFIVTIISMFMVTAAVGFVTSGFMQNLFGIQSSIITTTVLFAICGIILIKGKYNVLDKLIKIIGITLIITTLFAFVMTLYNGVEGNKNLLSEDLLPLQNKSKMFFILALMGWMPTAVDLSTWNSLWTIEKIKTSGYKPSLKETLFDFNFGYLASAILSICFVTMGAFILYGTNKTLPNDPAGFANGIVELYTSTIGNWAYIIIASAAFSIMFGTCIAVFDGYGRAFQKTSTLLLNKTVAGNKWYISSVIITIVGGFLMIEFFRNSSFGIKGLVNIATIIFFLIAPIIAIFNIILVRKKHIGENSPPLWIRVLSYLGIIYLVIFCIYFFVIKFSE